MVFKIVKKAVIYIPNKLVTINKNINKVINFPETADKTFTYVTKVNGVATGVAGAAIRAVYFAEAVACQDGVCALISVIGVTADGLQICTSFIPGPNVTAILTMPISVGCKVFVWCCKKSKSPWGGC